MVKPTKRLRTVLLAMAVAAAPMAASAGLAGDYLAARQASFLGDYNAAATYYGRALESDAENPELLERAVLANISVGDVGLAADLGADLAAMGLRSQLAQMAMVTQDAANQNYQAVLDAIAEERGLGPLADGLIAAWAQLGVGDMSAALVGFDTVAQRQGLGPFSMYQKALALASVGDFESADAILTGDAGGLAMTRRGLIAHAQVLSQLDRYDDAVALIDSAFGADLDPALSALRAALLAGEPVRFSQITSARDGMAEVFYTLSGALSNEDNDDLTLLYARMAQHLRPDHVDAILLAAEQLERLGQYALAVDAYGGVPSDHPAFHAAEMGRAEALRSQGQSDAAIAVLRGLTETHGDIASVHSALADTLRQVERYAEASVSYTDALDRIEEVGPNQWFLFYARGITFEREGNWPAAEADFRQALELNPGQPQVLNYLGYSLVEKRIKLDEALDMIERAVAAQPDSGYIVDSLGWVLYRLGRYEEAVVHMERAAELMPVDPVVNDHLGDVYWAVGRHLEAEFQWKRALSFADWGDAAEDVDQDRIRRKLEVGLDAVLAEEGAEPLRLAEESGADNGN